MSDQNFDFSSPPPRRERKEFEPPPWEKGRFDELQKQRAQLEPSSEPPEGGEPSEGNAEAPGVGPKPEAREAKESPGEAALVDEGQVTAMLFELRAEDPPVTGSFNKVGLIAGLILLATGILLVIWAIVMIVVATRRAEQGRSGALVGFTVLMFGAGFASAGAWFVFKSLRQQGVL